MPERPFFGHYLTSGRYFGQKKILFQFQKIKILGCLSIFIFKIKIAIVKNYKRNSTQCLEFAYCWKIYCLGKVLVFSLLDLIHFFHKSMEITILTNKKNLIAKDRNCIFGEFLKLYLQILFSKNLKTIL